MKLKIGRREKEQIIECDRFEIEIDGARYLIEKDVKFDFSISKQEGRGNDDSLNIHPEYSNQISVD